MERGLRALSMDTEITVPAILQRIADALPRWWVPEALVFVEAIPRTSTGKFLKTRLREQFAVWYAESTATEPAP